jgi:uncharacterized protein (TIGR03067 family)
MVRRRWPWPVVVGVVVLILVGATIWLLSGGDPGEGYTGPPPPVEFEIKGYKVASSVPFHGQLEILDSRIIPPRALDGYEFTTEHPEIILGRPHSFAWKVTSGVILLVACKVTAKEPAPQLQVAQPGFEKATAKDLNEGLADCHKNGKTPALSLVFRLPREDAANTARLAIELRWQNQDGKTLSGRISLKNAPRLPEESSQQATEEKAPTCDGEWWGQPSNQPHVRAIVIQKNTFPCLGEVRFAPKGGVRFEKPDKTISFEKNQIHIRGGKVIEVASPVEWTEKDGELVGTHTLSKQVVAKVKMSGRTLTGEAIVPPAVRLFLGNAETLKIAQFEKRKSAGSPEVAVGLTWPSYPFPPSELNKQANKRPVVTRPDPAAEAKAQPAKQVANREEVQKLQGWWQLVKSVSKDSELGNMSPPWGLRIEGERFTFVVFGQPGHQGSFTLDSTGAVKTIDLTITPKEGKAFIKRGIYKMDGQTLQMCLGEPDQDRPKEFDKAYGISYYKR